MYKRIVHFLQGSQLVQIQCACPERVLNLLGAKGILFWDLQWESEICLRLRMLLEQGPALEEIAGQTGAEMTVLRRRGIPVLWGRFHRRYVLLAGFAVFWLLLFGGNLFIWEFRVSGNETVPTETVLRALENYGITVGSPGLEIDQEDMRNHVLLEIPELSWVAVNVSGCRANVEVRERRTAPKPLDRKTPCNLVARRDGLVLRVQALGGVPQVMKGMSVTEGQLLISGVEDTGTFGTRFTAGLGSVEGRTWYTLTANVPLTGAEKRYTGREKRLHSVIFGSRRIKFFANSSIDSGQCDKITERTPVRVCGLPLPVIWETETLRFYETEPVTVTQARRQKETGAALEAYLHSLVDPYGEVTASQVTSRLRGDVLTVTLTAECREELGTQAPIYTANEPDGASG